MKERLVELLGCPRCRGRLALSVEKHEGPEILTGSLCCMSCGVYPITGGVPRLLLDAAEIPDLTQKTVDRFGAQWNDFDFITEHYEQQFLGWIGKENAEAFQGQVVLEGGCGKGRHSTIVATRYGAKDVIAVDLGSAVSAAWRNTRGHPNVHVVQADLHHLPVPDGTVDIAFSVGVLHHTPDPSECFSSLVRAVRPGGKVIAWVYGEENNGWIISLVNPVRERITSKIPHRFLYQAAKLPAAVVYGLARGVYRPLAEHTSFGSAMFYAPYMNQIAAFPFEEIHSIVHDHLTPPIAHYIPRHEFESWFKKNGLKDVQIHWHNKNSWRGSATR